MWDCLKPLIRIDEKMQFDLKNKGWYASCGELLNIQLRTIQYFYFYNECKAFTYACHCKRFECLLNSRNTKVQIWIHLSAWTWWVGLNDEKSQIAF